MFSSAAFSGNNYKHSGDDHFYNLEYDQAIQDYTKWIEENPSDPLAYNNIAGAHLYKEMLRLGLLGSAALGKNNGFLHQHPQPDPAEEARFLDMLGKAQHTAEAILAKDTRDKNGLFALCANYSLRSNYEFMLKRSWIPALRSASRAKSYCEQALKVDPDFIDATLLPGMFEYVAGSLPLPVRMFASIGGLHGSKKKGIEMVTRVAREGDCERDSASILLAVLYRREGRPLDSARILEGLANKYPKNYVFVMELASMYDEAGKPDKALFALKHLGEDNSRMPPAVQREISEMQTHLQPRASVEQPPATLGLR